MSNESATTPAEPTPTTPAPSTPAAATPTTPDPAAAKPAEGTGDEPSLIEGEGGETAPEEPFVPLTAEALKIPEGMSVADEVMNSFLTLANEAKLPAEVAQKLVDLQAGLAKETSETMIRDWENTQNEWRDAVKKDPAIGGDKLAGNLAAIKTMINEVAGEGAKEVFEVMTITGAGNNPAIVRLMAKLAKDYSEGSLAAAATAAEMPKDLASVMYPNQGKT